MSQIKETTRKPEENEATNELFEAANKIERYNPLYPSRDYSRGWNSGVGRMRDEAKKIIDRYTAELKCKTCGGSGEIENPDWDEVKEKHNIYQAKYIPCPDCKPEEPEAGEFTEELRKMLAGKQTTLKLKRIYTAAKKACNIIDNQAEQLRFMRDEIYEAYIHNEISPELYGKLKEKQDAY